MHCFAPEEQRMGETLCKLHCWAGNAALRGMGGWSSWLCGVRSNAKSLDRHGWCLCHLHPFSVREALSVEILNNAKRGTWPST
jgi:hypothetical protein